MRFTDSRIEKEAPQVLHQVLFRLRIMRCGISHFRNLLCPKHPSHLSFLRHFLISSPFLSLSPPLTALSHVPPPPPPPPLSFHLPFLSRTYLLIHSSTFLKHISQFLNLRQKRNALWRIMEHVPRCKATQEKGKKNV